MKRLRVLDAHSNRGSDYFSSDWKFDQVSQYLPNALRYLRWESYPYQSLPETFHANNLVGLEMPYSNIAQLWEGRERKVEY